MGRPRKAEGGNEPEVIETGGIESAGERLVSEGKTLVKTQTPFVTAIKVQVPRDLANVRNGVLSEASLAGDRFYYMWTLKSGKSKGKRIMGGSIGLALAMQRNWGNCWTQVDYTENDEYGFFNVTFIDFEKGSNLQRIYKFRKDSGGPGMYEPERAQDMSFQKHESKSMRNVILDYMPQYLVDEAIETAMEAEINKITKEGLPGAIQRAIDFYAKHNITLEQLEKKIDKTRDKWTAMDVADLRGLAQAIKSGEINVQDEFGTSAPEPEKKEEGAVKVDDVLNVQVNAGTTQLQPSLFEEGKKQQNEEQRKTMIATIKTYRKKIGDGIVDSMLKELKVEKEEDLDLANLNVLYASCVAESKKKK